MGPDKQTAASAARPAARQMFIASLPLSRRRPRCSAEGAEIDLSGKGIDGGRHRLRPVLIVDLWPLRGGPRPAVPSHLLHVVVELERVAIGVEGKGAIIDAGAQLLPETLDRNAGRLQEAHRVPPPFVFAHP